MSGKRSLVLVVWLPIVLCGCAADANTSFMPEFLKQPAPKVDVKQPPDVASIVRSDITTIFTAASNPTDIAFSLPIPAKYGGWTTCIRASVTGATGRPMGLQTFLVNIDQGRVERRERVDEHHWCDRETFQPLSRTSHSAAME